MRINEYKYQLLSIINLSLEKKSYNSSLHETIKYFGYYIKDLELEIDSISENIRNNLENNDYNITMELLILKKLIEENL